MKSFNKLLVLAVLLVCSVAYAQFPAVVKLMNGSVIPNSSHVFSAGKQAPKSEAEWNAVQKSAEILVANSRQLMPMGPDTGREAWVQYTEALGAASRKAADAAKARSVDGLRAAGDAMFEICEGCHRLYMKQ